jgi:hypothetical protein
VQFSPNIYFLSLRTNFLALTRYPFLCPELFSGSFTIDNKVKMLSSENEFFHQEIIADQSFGCFQLIFIAI